MRRLLLALFIVAASAMQADAGHRRIRVEDPNHVAPCSVPTQICLCDPYTGCMVQLTVCMPCRVCPTVHNGGRLVRYSFGKHEVEIHFKRHSIVIDYDD